MIVKLRNGTILYGAEVEHIEHNHIKLTWCGRIYYLPESRYTIEAADTAATYTVELHRDRPFDHFDTEIQCEEYYY